MAVFNKPSFNTVWAATGVKIKPADDKIAQGWIVEIPPYEYDNWILNRQDAFSAHVNQTGIGVWDNTTEYQANKSYVQGPSTGIIYRAASTNTNTNPDLDINGVWKIAFQAEGQSLLKAQNLADVPDKAAARDNLGISTTTDYDLRYLQKSLNFADVPNKATARNNMGLGNSSTLNVGEVASTVAAGDDPRIVNATPNTRTVKAGVGLSGGGNLAADRTISLATPSTVTRLSGNTVSATTHSHAIDINSIIPSMASPNGEVQLGNIRIQWGRTDYIPVGGTIFVPFSKRMSGVYSITCTPAGPIGDRVSSFLINGYTTDGFNLAHDYMSGANISRYGMWFAVGSAW